MAAAQLKAPNHGRVYSVPSKAPIPTKPWAARERLATGSLPSQSICVPGVCALLGRETANSQTNRQKVEEPPCKRGS